jgi:hypothetical protein
MVWNEFSLPTSSQEALTKIRAAHGNYAEKIVEYLDDSTCTYDIGRVINALDLLNDAYSSIVQAVTLPMAIERAATSPVAASK